MIKLYERKRIDPICFICIVSRFRKREFIVKKKESSVQNAALLHDFGDQASGDGDTADT